MNIDSMSFLLNESVWLSSKTFKLFKYFVICLLLNVFINALNFGMLMMWIIELRLGL